MSLYLTGAPNLQLHPLSGFGAPDPLPGVCFFSFFHIEILLLLGQVCVCSVTHFTCKDGVISLIRETVGPPFPTRHKLQAGRNRHPCLGTGCQYLQQATLGRRTNTHVLP